MGDGGKEFLLLQNDKVTMGQEGYLVAWQYLIGTTSARCRSYAAVWRGNRSGYHNVVSEKLLPQDLNLGGRQFQYSSKSVEVKPGDILGIYVERGVSCDGHIIASRVNPSTQQLRYIGADQSTETHYAYLSRNTLTTVGTDVALKIFIASMSSSFFLFFDSERKILYNHIEPLVSHFYVALPLVLTHANLIQPYRLKMRFEETYFLKL